MRSEAFRIIDRDVGRRRRLSLAFVKAVANHRGEGWVLGPVYASRYEAMLARESTRHWLRRRYPDMKPALAVVLTENGWQLAGRLEPREVR